MIFWTNIGEQRFLNSSCAMIILIPTGCESMNYNDSYKTILDPLWSLISHSPALDRQMSVVVSSF